jgi:hypothetical protein
MAGDATPTLECASRALRETAGVTQAGWATRLGYELRTIQRWEADYEEVRKIWNAAIEKRPAIFARCTGNEDVIAGLHYACEHDLEVAVGETGFAVDTWDQRQTEGFGRTVNVSTAADRPEQLRAASGGHLQHLAVHGLQFRGDQSKYRRLSEIKSRYDPQNVLRVNQNIKPA